MKSYIKVESFEKPMEIEITDYKVFVAKNIQEIKFDGEDNTNLYTYDYYEYTKDEYMEAMAKSNIEKEKAITQLQLALYENMEQEFADSDSGEDEEKEQTE